jgi:uncharacterized membrane protein (DUF4010 family)
MELAYVFYRFGVALAIGFLIGLQREYAYGTDDSRPGLDKEILAGARTFSLLGLYGCACAFLGDVWGALWVTVALALPAGVLIIATYIVNALRGGLGMTTEMAGLMTLIMGMLCYIDQLALAAALGVVTMTLLSLKLQIQSLARRISREDVYATVKFAVITALILPVLPRTGYGPPPFDVLVPYNVWLMVVFISGIGFFGYVLIKFVGAERGAGLTGILGGLVSSTAATLSLAQSSRAEKGFSRAFAMGIMAAWTVMFLRVMVIVAVLNPSLLRGIWKAMLVSLSASALYCVYLYMQQRSGSSEEAKVFRNPFELGPALTFGLLYAVILLAVNTAAMFFGEAGVYVSSVVSGLVDVDAVTISMSRLSGAQSGFDLGVAGHAVVLAAASNTFLKGMIVLLAASSQVKRLVLPGMVLLVVVTVLASSLLV